MNACIHSTCYDVQIKTNNTLAKVRNKSMKKKTLDVAGIWTQDFLNTSQMILPVSHFVTVDRETKD